MSRAIHRLVLVFASALLLISSCTALLLPAAVQAACPDSCDWPSVGRDFFQGYLTGQPAQGGEGLGGSVWGFDEAPASYNGGAGVSSAADFINWMDPWIHDTSNGSINDHTGAAAYVITAMLGYKGPDFGNDFLTGVNTARTNWGKWQDLVKQYDANGWVQWHQMQPFCYGDVQANLDYSLHDVFFFDNVYDSGCETEEEIIFNNPETGSKFILKTICGNPVGENKPLDTPPPTEPPTPPTPPEPPTTQPTFSVAGGDVVAGAGFAAPDGSGGVVPCSAAPHNDNAGIASWNNKGAPDYAGAGGEYAAMALNYIQGFASSQGHSPPTGLSFANVNTSGSVNPSAGMFGGMFTKSVTACVDYWSTKPKQADLTSFSGVNLNSLDAGAYNYWAQPSGSPLQLGNINIKDGVHVTLYVEGDVHITGQHIKYQNSSWSSTQDIPSFRLIVHGSIFIDGSVDTLDGTYVAVPDKGYEAAPNDYGAPKAGTISTCANGNGSYNPLGASDNKYQNDCNHLLTVNGSFVANQVWLLRTYGSVGGAQAEVFNYGPEVWLAQTGSPSLGSSYTSVSGLPPVL